MPLLKTYFRYLTHEDRARCQIELEKGEGRKFVIQYEIFIQGEWSAVTRFDTFHDAVHRDLIAPMVWSPKDGFSSLILTKA